VLSLETTGRWTGDADAIGGGFCASIDGCQCHLSNATREQAEQERECFHGRMGGWCPRIVSPEQGSGKTITLADLIGKNAPLITLAIRAQCGGENALPLHLHHNGVNSALMLTGVHSHAAHNVAACLLAVLNQCGADGGADGGSEVHRSGVVN